MLTLSLEPLTREAFAPFGELIEIDGSEQFEINSGYTTRVHDLISIQLEGADARPQLSFFLGRPRPLEIRMLERHPLGSQAFYPVDNKNWIVAVSTEPKATCIRAFLATGRQGVNYYKNIWHHPLLVFEPQQFVIIDRGGKGKNCEEIFFDTDSVVCIKI